MMYKYDGGCIPQELLKHRNLSHEETLELAEKRDRVLSLLHRLDRRYPQLYRESRIQEGRRAKLNEMYENILDYVIRHNLKLIKTYTDRAHARFPNISLDQFVSDAFQCAIKGWDKWNPERSEGKAKFSTMLTRYILNSNKRLVTTVSRKKVNKILSFDADSQDEIYGSRRWKEIADPKYSGPEHLEIKEESLGALREVLNGLTDVERRVINMRYLDEDKMTLEEAGRVLGVTKERIRQIQNRALGRLGDFLALKSLNAEADDYSPV